MDKFEMLRPYIWRIFCGVLGFISAILFLTIGFFKTAVILLCCGIGYAIGVCHDKKWPVLEWVLMWRNRL